MSDRRRVRACPECWATFSRSSSVRRHVLSVHQLGYVDGRTVTLTPIEIRQNLEALRLQQMSSRTRRRHHARTADVTGPTNSSLVSRVAVIRRPNEDDDDKVTFAGAGTGHDTTDLWGDWPNFEELYLPSPVREAENTVTQTEPVDIRGAPTILYSAETQTSAPQTVSVACMTERQSVGWPAELSFRAAVGYCRDNSTLSAERITADLCFPHPNITQDQRSWILSVLNGVTAGIDAMAKKIRDTVNAGGHVTTEGEYARFLNSLEGLWATLGEYENRPHY